MRCFAHRGFAESFPENTLAAVRGAVAAGADAVEVDVRRCATGEPVVVHDATVDRVTDGEGEIADLPLSTLRSLDVLGSGEGIPTLAEVVEAVPPEVILNVELKERGLAADVLRIAGAADLLVSSFERGALREPAAAGDVPLALLFAADGRDSLSAAADLGCAAVHPHHSLCDRAFVERAHQRGFAVNAWTVRSTTTARRLGRVGVDGLIADAPGYCALRDSPGSV